ncbi:MAG UNVERIFIED_CONTAM: SufD family Fe-S cluster assembly protein [Anaerolineae bacterium]|jgi:Fe-S cluster assembly protein SufB
MPLGTVSQRAAAPDSAVERGLVVCRDHRRKTLPRQARECFATVIPAADNKFAALNSAVWSGGSLVYVPKGIQVDIPLQAYFRINAENMGQFERTLIIVEEGASVHYVEGCTASIYSSNSLHSAVVEIIIKKGSALPLYDDPELEHRCLQPGDKACDCLRRGDHGMDRRQPGSKVTMKYPAVYMMGPKAHGEVLSIAFAGRGQHQDAGGKVVHVLLRTPAPRSSPSRSAKTAAGPAIEVCSRWAREPTTAKAMSSATRCCSTRRSRSDTYPYIEIEEEQVSVGHEASVSKIGEEQLFYLMSRGLARMRRQP